MPVRKMQQLVQQLLPVGLLWKQCRWKGKYRPFVHLNYSGHRAHQWYHSADFKWIGCIDWALYKWQRVWCGVWSVGSLPAEQTLAEQWMNALSSQWCPVLLLEYRVGRVHTSMMLCYVYLHDHKVCVMVLRLQQVRELSELRDNGCAYHI